jgi:hypothetical protein
MLCSYVYLNNLLTIKTSFMRKLSRTKLKTINGGVCPGGCPYPPGTGYGPSYGVRSCAAYQALTNCCQIQYFLEWKCAVVVDL